MGAYDNLYATDGGTASDGSGGDLNFGGTNNSYDLSSSGAVDTSGTGVSATAPSDTGNGFWGAVNQGISSFQNLANAGLGLYKSVQQSNAQQTAGQPERTPDGRYVANIQGRPTVLQASPAPNTTLIYLALILGAFVLLRKAV